jgi:MGT family glycosyltransferase
VNVVIATWQAGGGSQPALGLGRRLAEHGHSVRIFGPAAYADRVAAVGCRLRPLPTVCEFDPARGRRMEDQPEFLGRLFFGSELPEALAAELTAESADLVVVDYLLRSLVCCAEQLPVPSLLLIHTTFRFHGGAGDDEAARRRWYEPVNAVRARSGLQPLPAGSDSVTVALVRQAAGALVVLPREYDDWADPPAGVVHVGPITEEATPTGWDSPWPLDDDRPLIVVSMGTTYMAHEQVLGRVMQALNSTEARVLVLTGAELAPAEIDSVPGVHVRRYLPHSAVMPDAALVVTHAGTGTLMASFTAAVPVICIPLGRDQDGNSRRVEELGLGALLPPSASLAEIRRATADALASPPMHDAARRMADAIRSYGNGARAIAALESLHPDSKKRS